MIAADDGIIEPLNKPFEGNNRSEIVSELSHNASESQINEPKKIDRLENQPPPKTYFTGSRAKAIED